MNKIIEMKHWQGVMLLALSGFAIGTILAKIANALGI